MRRLILLLVIINAWQIGEASDSTQSTEQERAIAFVIREEATDYALEARGDVCVGFSTDLQVRERIIRAALKDKGLNFHELAWCNRGPRGVTIFITLPSKQASPGIYEIVSQIDDSDPIRLYGDHFATMLRRSTYKIKCEKGSEPVLELHLVTCCEKGKPKSQPSPSLN